MTNEGTFVTTPLASPLRKRLLLFVLASLTLALLVCWAAATAIFQIGAMRQSFSTVQRESLRIAAHLQSSTAAMHSSLMAYEISGEEKEWDTFKADAAKLDRWLAAQHATMKSERERSALAEIDRNFDNYLRQASATAGERRKLGAPSIDRIRTLDEATQELLTDDSHLAEAHQRALGEFLDANTHSLRLLEFFMIGAFTSVIGLGAWGGGIVYKHAISPLQVKLIESRALLERREKLASLGVLAAGVAHEIRNPLTAIKARLFTQQKKLERASQPYQDSQFISAEINRLERIVRDFLEFARPSDPERVAIPVNLVLNEVHELLLPELEKNQLGFVLEGCQPEDLTIEGDRNQLKQVLINLIRNAAESTPSYGQVIVRARRSSETAILEVADTGHGIAAEIQKRLFDPFFTTKPNGTGLGLSITAQIVERHHGRLQFQTSPGKGTTFGIILPLHQPQ